MAVRTAAGGCRGWLAAAVALAALSAASCSAGADPGPTGSPSAPGGAPSSSAATPSTPVDTTPTPAQGPDAPAGDCLTGSYRLDRFVGVGDSQTYGTGAGGDVTVTFSDGAYTLTGAGQDPIRLTLAGGTGDLLVNGTVEGTYTGDGPQYAFTVGESDGTATLTVGGQTQALSMADVAKVVAPDGQATVACNPPRMVLLLPAVRLELSRA